MRYIPKAGHDYNVRHICEGMTLTTIQGNSLVITVLSSSDESFELGIKKPEHEVVVTFGLSRDQIDSLLDILLSM